MASPTAFIDDVIDSASLITSQAVPFGAAVPGGGTVTCFLFVSIVYGSGLPSTLTDSQGNTWTRVGATFGSGTTNNDQGLDTAEAVQVFGHQPTPQMGRYYDLSFTAVVVEHTFAV